MQKLLIVIGFIFILLGILLPYIKKLGLGHLPGDLIIKRAHFTFYFPIMTCLILSVILSLLIWWLQK